MVIGLSKKKAAKDLRRLPALSAEPRLVAVCGRTSA